MLYIEIMLPVFILVGATFALWFARVRGRPLPADSAAVGAAPLDVLFYVAVALCLPLRRADWGMVILSWVYVVIRVLETAGPQIWRGRGAQGLGNIGTMAAVVLLIMWIYFALEFLLAF